MIIDKSSYNLSSLTISLVSVHKRIGGEEEKDGLSKADGGRA